MKQDAGSVPQLKLKMPEAADLNVDELRRRARRRLIGAIVLALVAATVVPMLLESEQKPLGEEVSVVIPPIDDSKFVNRLTDSSKRDPASTGATKVEAGKDPVKVDAATDKDARKEAKETPPKDGAKEGGAAAPVAQAPKKPLAEAEQRVLAPTAKKDTPGAPAAVPPVKADAPVPPKSTVSPSNDAAKSETTKEGFAVQLAAFGDDKGANALANKLKRAGYPAYTESLPTAKSTLWRVRVGPYPSRDAAGLARAKLKDDGYTGIVAPAR